MCNFCQWESVEFSRHSAIKHSANCSATAPARETGTSHSRVRIQIERIDKRPADPSRFCRLFVINIYWHWYLRLCPIVTYAERFIRSATPARITQLQRLCLQEVLSPLNGRLTLSHMMTWRTSRLRYMRLVFLRARKVHQRRNSGNWGVG